MVTTRLERLFNFTPSFYSAEDNPMIRGILMAFANEDEQISLAIQDAKDQIFIRRATGIYLDYLGANFGVSRPTGIPFPDDKFRQYIIDVTWNSRQTVGDIYRVLELIWSPEYLHATTTSQNWETYNLVGGEVLNIRVDRTYEVSVVFRAEDITPGAATAQQVVDRINEWLPEYVFAWVYTDGHTGHTVVKISTNTYGSQGTIQVTGGDANLQLQFPTDEMNNARVSVYEVNPGEVVIEIPRNIIMNHDMLEGAHRFHADETIFATLPPPPGYWPGSFFYDNENSPTPGVIGLTSVKANLAANMVDTTIQTTNVSRFPDSTGYLVFDFGKDTQEVLKYRRRLTDFSLVIDSLYVWPPVQTHLAGDEFNLCYVYPRNMDITTMPPNTPKIPRIDGRDYPFFFLDPSVGQQITQQVLPLVMAAGVVVRWILTDG